jgi:hypothetical protein
MGCTIDPLVLSNVQDGQGVEIIVGYTGGGITIACIGADCDPADCYAAAEFKWHSCMNANNWQTGPSPKTFAYPPGPGDGAKIQLILVRVALLCCIDGTWGVVEEVSDSLMYYWLEYGQQGPSWYVQGLFEEIYPP